MSLVTRSKLRNRDYPRAFDHDEAIRLRAENPALWTYKALAEHFGVSSTGIERVLRPELRERMARRSLAAARKNRKPCVGGCERLVWQVTKNRSGYCAKCVGAQTANPNVRENELRCTRCEKWKPDAEFPMSSKEHHARRGHRTHCRACSTVIRREFRRTHPEQETASSRRYYHEVRRERRGIVAEYVVLRQEGEGSYQEVGTIEAPTPDAAVERIVAGEGSYVAVLTSRFDVVTVTPILSLRVVRDE